MSNTFGFYSTAEEVAENVDLTNKNVIITGSNSGIGLEAARVIAKRGATVIMACRDSPKTQQALEEVRAYSQNPNVRAISLDLSSLQSVRDFVAEYNKSSNNAPVHVLLNNAGVMACPQGKTAEGFETQFGTNHLGHFLLTNLLLPNLKAGSPSRVVNVSSSAHRYSGVNFNDPNFERTAYKPWVAYGQSKTANILFSVEFARRYASEGIACNALHPGVIQTSLMRHNDYPGTGLFFKIGSFLGFCKNIQQGAATETLLAVSPKVEGVNGKFFADCKETEPKDYAKDPEAAKRLWELSEKLVGM
jgi:NAD(P)-dependent dehydrogenase (short-subunit alcohol dehydrogenase family)